MRVKFEIDAEVSHEYVLLDILTTLQMMLPYMADNVLVKMRVDKDDEPDLPSDGD